MCAPLLVPLTITTIKLFCVIASAPNRCRLQGDGNLHGVLHHPSGIC